MLALLQIARPCQRWNALATPLEACTRATCAPPAFAGRGRASRSARRRAARWRAASRCRATPVPARSRAPGMRQVAARCRLELVAAVVVLVPRGLVPAVPLVRVRLQVEVGGEPRRGLARQLVGALEAHRAHRLAKLFPRQRARVVRVPLRGDLGFSRTGREPVIDLLVRRTPVSAELAIWSAIPIIVIGICIVICTIICIR